jgi:predicted amidohydrolase YtcJ
MLLPYTTAPDLPEDFSGGPILIDPEVLQQDLIELDRRGFTVKMHTAGDRAVRSALDAIQTARDANGPSGFRHEAAHAGFVDPADIRRFVQLDAVADLSPALWAPSPIIESVLEAVGVERGSRYFPIRTMLESGVTVLAGTDWPAAAASANPWPGMEAMVTRQDPTGATEGSLWPEEAISLEQAIHIYTLQGAAALRKDRRIGSIEVGKSADMILLDRNLFEIDPDEIGDTQVLKTWFEGALVYEAAHESPD